MSHKTSVSPASLFSVRLEQRRNGKHLGFGSGFIYWHPASRKHFLVTNYHVLTARNPRNPSFLEPGYADSPDELQWVSYTRGNGYQAKTGGVTLQGELEFLEHSCRSDGVDIVALPIQFDDQAIPFDQRYLNLDTTLDVSAGSEVFIVGYPFGFGVNEILPIWKRGTVASEPSVLVDGMQKFLVDAYSHPGMSGSPVFVVARGKEFLLSGDAARKWAAHERGEISATDLLKSIDVEEMQSTIREGLSLNLAGIYSGRITLPNNKDPNLGVVYGFGLVEEMFQEPVLAKHPYPPE